jgi:dTDP-4-dehydrorhamnose 3,5-epimerase
MKFLSTKFLDAHLIQSEPQWDERGYFARTFCAEEFAQLGLESNFVQHSTSFSANKGTLRGMHYQEAPHSEVKLVRCLRGAIWDVIVDIRSTSPTFGCWQGFKLSASNGSALYIPKGFAHGFQALSDDVEVGYLISVPYSPSAARGVRYDDPTVGIQWPLAVSVISEKDRTWPKLLHGPPEPRNCVGETRGNLFI